MTRTLLLLPLFLAPALSAQQSGTAPVTDHELIQQLLQRVKDLEAQVRQLKGEPAPAAAAAAQPAAAAPTPVPTVAPAPSQAMQDMMHEGPMPGTQGIQFRGFSDVRFSASDARNEHSTFATGQFNLFITSKLSDKFSVLGEMVFEAESNNAIGVDLERLLFQYSASDYFNLSLGRYHTAIGFYNTAYHHSTWMQTSLDRPFLFEFEDGGGILPVHNVGLSATGRIPSGALGLHYVAELGNGRTSRSPLDEAVQNVQDENNRKSVNFGIFARPGNLRGFQAGFSAYHDVLYPEGMRKIGQTIYAGHAVYQASGWEALNEVVVVRHNQQGKGVSTIPAFYSQLSRQFGIWRPYFRYEYMNVPVREPLFRDVGLRHGPAAGLRLDFTDFAAFKLEYDRVMRRSMPAANMFRTQVSFTF